MIASDEVKTEMSVIRPLLVIAMVFLIAITFNPIFAEGEVQDGFDGFFGYIGSSIKTFVGDDFSEDQTDKINDTIDYGIESGSIAVTMWTTFHHFVVSLMLMIASLFGVTLNETVAYVLGVAITLFIVGMLLKHFIFESWKIVLVIVILLAVLMFVGVTFVEI